jgi:hypothetical protein
LAEPNPQENLKHSVIQLYYNHKSAENEKGGPQGYSSVPRGENAPDTAWYDNPQ